MRLLALQLGLVALYDLWKKTTGTLSLDLKRRQFKGGAPGDSLWRLQPAAAGGGGAGPRGRRRQACLCWCACSNMHAAGARRGTAPLPPHASCGPPCLRPHRRGRPPARAQPTYFGQPAAPAGTYAAGGRGGYSGGYATGGGGGYATGGAGGVDLFDLPSLSFMDTGARIKVMRHVEVRQAPAHACTCLSECGVQLLTRSPAGSPFALVPLCRPGEGVPATPAAVLLSCQQCALHLVPPRMPAVWPKGGGGAARRRHAAGAQPGPWGGALL